MVLPTGPPHYLDDCHCGTDHRMEAIKAQERGEVIKNGCGEEMVIPPRTHQQHEARRKLREKKAAE